MSLAKDLKLGFRMLARKPTFTLLAVLTLALGIGANTAIFSVIHGVLLKPLPYADSDRLVQVWNRYPLMNLPQASVSIPDYIDRRAGVEAFEESALYYFQSFNLVSEGPPERIVGLRATASLFPLLGSAPLMGRAFSAEDDQPGKDPVVVIGFGLWKKQFGGDDSVVGRDIRLNSEPHQVVGVMKEDFVFPNANVQIWKPFAYTSEQASDDSRGNEFSRMLARLAPGATIGQAQRQIDRIHERNLERFPDSASFWKSSGFGGMAVDFRKDLFGDLEPYLLLLQAVVGFVLLIACANVANLLLTRLAARQRELAVRSALGAGRWRLARQLLMESLLMAFAAGVVGISIGYAGIRLLSWLGIEPSAAGVEIRLDPGVLLFTFALALVTGIVFSLFPLFSVWKTDPNDVLKEGGRGGHGGRHAALPRNVLVVSEVAMALVLLAGAGLMVRTMSALQKESPGFSQSQVLTAQVNLPSAKYTEEAAIVAFYDQALSRLQALPGVRSTGLISQAPFSGSSSSGSYSIKGYTRSEGESAPHGFQRVVDESYFETLEIPLRQGRLFNNLDSAETEQVVVVDRTLVDKYFQGQDPLGQQISRSGREGPFLTIVGVVEPVKIRDLTQPVTKETIYYPYRQAPRNQMTFVLKTETDPTTLAKTVQGTILEVDPELPAYNVVTLEEQLSGSFETRRVSMVLLVAFGALAALLAAVGIYGVLAFSIAQRSREIGIRVAMGARPRQILEMVFGQGLILTLIGVGIGTLAALGLGRLLSSILFGVPTYDPATFISVSFLLIAISLLACYRPARKAVSVDPIEALRNE